MGIMKHVVKPYIIFIMICEILVTVVYAHIPYGKAVAVGADMCMADSIRYIDWNPARIILILTTVIAYMLIQKNNHNNIMNVLYMKERRKIYINDIKEIIPFAISISMLITFTAIISGEVFSGFTSMNWKDINSYASLSVGTALQNKNIFIILFAAFIIYFLQIIFSLEIIILIYYLLNTYIGGLAIITALGLWELRGSDNFKIYYSRFGISRRDWFYFGAKDYLFIFGALVVLDIVIYLIGLRISRRKEFY